MSSSITVCSDCAAQIKDHGKYTLEIRSVKFTWRVFWGRCIICGGSTGAPASREAHFVSGALWILVTVTVGELFNPLVGAMTGTGFAFLIMWLLRRGQ